MLIWDDCRTSSVHLPRFFSRPGTADHDLDHFVCARKCNWPFPTYLHSQTPNTLKNKLLVSLGDTLDASSRFFVQALPLHIYQTCAIERSSCCVIVRALALEFDLPSPGLANWPLELPRPYWGSRVRRSSLLGQDYPLTLRRTSMNASCTQSRDEH